MKASGPAAVSLDSVVVRYGSRTALDGVSLTVPAGERLAVIGPSGAGKSTLLGVLNGLVPATTGRVDVLGVDLAAARGRDLQRVRRRIGTIHQQLHLVGPLRVVHNVNAGRLGAWSPAKALWSLWRPQGVRDVRQALEHVDLAARLYDRTDTLSGGEQQRVALARVAVQDPDLVLADEPVSSLDPVLAADVLRLLCGIVAEGDRTLITSLHDVGLARRFCDRVVGLREGRVVFDLTAGEVTPAVTRDLYGQGVNGGVRP